MNNKFLVKIANISGWILLAILIFYFVSGYSMVYKYGMDSIMSNSQAWYWHKSLTIPFFIFLLLHIVPYFIVRKQPGRFFVILAIVIILPILTALAIDKLHKPGFNSSVEIKQKDKAIICPNCPEECLIKPGKTGKCGKFKNIDGYLKPVEKNKDLQDKTIVK